MGLLSAGQKAAIAARAPIRQVFNILVPSTSGGTSYTSNKIHDDLGGPYYVTNAGQRRVTAYNVSMKDPGTFGVGLYVIEVDNSSGIFSPYAASHVWNPTWSDDEATDYDANPRECLLQHKVYVLVDGSWSEITGVRYLGTVIDPKYNELQKTAEISSEAVVADTLRTAWSKDDGDTIETGMAVSI